MSRPEGLRCDPKGVFELADGEISPVRELEIRSHLDRCPGCRELFEDEMDLNARLDGLEMNETRSVCREVAMFLPTRPIVARLVWVAQAGTLLLAAALALSLNGANPAAFAVEAVGAFWGFVSGLSDVVEAFLAVAGPALLVALGVGAFVDVIIAGVVLSVSRRRAREA